MNEVREVLNDIVHKLESQSTFKLLKEVRNEVKTVRDKLLKAHEEIARLEDEVTVKFFNRKSPKIVELEPANDDFENIIVDLEYQDFHIEGKSVGLLRKN